MASEKRGARSAAIRQYLAEHPTAGPKEVADSLKLAGVEVSTNLVSAIKYGKMSNKAGAKQTERPARRGGRARLSGSEAIRRLLSKNPNASPKAIHVRLTKRGINVSYGLISNVKFNFKNGPKAPAAKTPTAKAPAVQVAARKTAAPQISFEQLIEVKKIADSLGGAVNLRQALDMLAQLS